MSEQTPRPKTDHDEADWRFYVGALAMGGLTAVCVSFGARLIVGGILVAYNGVAGDLDEGGRAFILAMCGVFILTFAGVLGYLARKLWRAA